MLDATVIQGNPASVAIALTPSQIAACAHALTAARDARFRLAEMTADDVVALRDLTAAIDALDAEARHGESATVVLIAARLLLVSTAVREFADAAGETDTPNEAALAYGRIAAALVDPLADLAARVMNEALAELPEGELDDDAFDALLRGE